MIQTHLNPRIMGKFFYLNILYNDSIENWVWLGLELRLLLTNLISSSHRSWTSIHDSSQSSSLQSSLDYRSEPIPLAKTFLCKDSKTYTDFVLSLKPLSLVRLPAVIDTAESDFEKPLSQTPQCH